MQYLSSTLRLHRIVTTMGELLVGTVSKKMGEGIAAGAGLGALSVMSGAIATIGYPGAEREKMFIGTIVGMGTLGAISLGALSSGGTVMFGVGVAAGILGSSSSLYGNSVTSLFALILGIEAINLKLAVIVGVFEQEAVAPLTSISDATLCAALSVGLISTISKSLEIAEGVKLGVLVELATIAGALPWLTGKLPCSLPELESSEEIGKELAMTIGIGAVTLGVVAGAIGVGALEYEGTWIEKAGKTSSIIIDSMMVGVGAQLAIDLVDII